MGSRALKFLGDLEIARCGERVELPPSRKTRALLADLAPTGRAFRREHLCEPLWEIPDDPRGSLRWSLSKCAGSSTMRRASDRRRSARRGLRRDDAAIDVAALAAIARGQLDEAPLEELERPPGDCGTPLEGLEIPTFHDYSAWYMGEREHATANQVRC